MIRMEVLNIKDVEKRFKDMMARTKAPATAMDVIAAIGWKDVIDHFNKEEGPGYRWKGLAQSTLEGRKGGKTRSSGSAIKILQNTGFLRQSHRYRVVDKEAHVYTDCSYANYHNSDEPRSKLPQRRFLWLSEKARLLCQKTILRWIVEGKATGL